VVGSGGRALWDAFERAPEVALASDPLDAYTRRVTEAAARELAPAHAHALFSFEQRAGVYADFVALGRLAGLGAPSRLGLLLHPVYGPWVSLRAVVLTTASWVPDSPQLQGQPFDPCRDCPAPCAAICPGAAVAASGFDVARCGATRAALPDCRSSCASRRACVVGPEHAYSEAALAHHMSHVRLP
jgi:epoxyqueuosine reductase QueG